ncbi:hypothetical protein DL96DRAFT_1621434 [Flagelloscypha sp. PMI_526]|nr:hypothetical protein DL96DRAFT_1621434 [Flagelloscypha sp. PMI_526]
MVPSTIAKIFTLLFIAHFTFAIPRLESGEFGGSAAASRRNLNHPTRTLNARLSNAERLRRGLPLKKPVMRGLGYRDGAPATPSANVPIYRRAVIQAFSSEPGGSTMLYYVSNTPTSGMVGLTSSIDSALIVRYDTTLSGPYNLEIENGQDDLAVYPNLGLTFSLSPPTNTIGRSSYNYCYFTSTNPTPQGSTPVMQGSSVSSTDASETAVFTVDPDDNLELRWKNPDGSSPFVFVVYTSQPNHIVITGDIAAYQHIFGSDTKLVKLMLVDAP